MSLASLGKMMHKPLYTPQPGGWIIRHCGHATANWPYYLEHPDFDSRIVVSFNGYGFKTLAFAKAAVAGILDGSIEVTTEDCFPRVARTRGFNALGEHVRDDEIIERKKSA